MALDHPVAIAVCLALTAGCTDATPNGTELFSETLETPSEVTESRAKISIGDEQPSVIELTIGTSETGGAKVIATVRGKVVDNGGWQLSYGGKGNPVNLGTTEAPVMAQPFMLNRFREDISGKHSSQSMVTVKADGTAEVQ